jgi:hypothetical protein
MYKRRKLSCNTCLQNAENEMAIIAAYYGLPTLSVRAAVFHQMLKNQHGYRVRGPWLLLCVG